LPPITRCGRCPAPIAAHSQFGRTRRAPYDILLDNSRRFLTGQPLRNVVDKSSWF
jgi:hypothetical protein